MRLYWLSVTYNSIFGLQNKHFVRYSTTWHITSNVSNTSYSYYSYCTKLLLQPLCHILTSQTSKYEATSQLASPRGEARWVTFLVPHTSYEVSQLARIVNEASELSIALTHLMSNSPCLALSRLVAISGCITRERWLNEEDVRTEDKENTWGDVNSMKRTSDVLKSDG